MKPFYEVLRDNQTSVHFVRNVNYIFRPHFHSAFEILVVKKGRCPVTINGKDYVVTDGQIAFFDSFEIHGYYDNSDKDCDTMVVIFPVTFAEKFIAKKGDGRLNDFVITDAQLCETLIDLVEKFIAPNFSQDVTGAGVELFLSLLYPKLNFSNTERGASQNLVMDILKYLNISFKEDVNLNTVSKKFGYTPAHVSRVFNKYVKRTIKEFVNDLRIEYVLKRLDDLPKPSITDLIYQAGFNSAQTYYRNLAKYNKN